ncbi:MAG: hypothetical protein JJLCMIEE_01114 [Acidimicrobiales bacterium]|nr:MAG: hypothetical protein EDR02_11555 [Actinomycetota bacterium]MBV6508055.1 hypothetical protein [Acidimicrobiales bacterium]RIK05318.1 MAG: hypothetical protein DCC48_10595 [Acidobacteriota bacterium]
MPYVDMPVHDAPEAAFVVYTVLMALVSIGFLAWWALSAQRRQEPVLPLLLLGGAVAGLVEPFLDNVVLFWWPPEQQTELFEAFGRTIPLFVPIGYAWFCGGLLYFAARLYDRGAGAGHVWLLFAAVAVVDFVAIGLTTWLGIAGFFGGAPMRIAGFPLWWAAIDGVDVILGGAVVWFLTPVLRGRRRLYLVLVPPVMIGMAGGGIGWPISTALNSGWSTPAKWAAAAVTIGLGLSIVHLVAQVVARSNRLQEASGAGGSSRWDQLVAKRQL